MPDRLHNGSDIEGCRTRRQDSQHAYCHLFISLVVVFKSVCVNARKGLGPKCSVSNTLGRRLSILF